MARQLEDFNALLALFNARGVEYVIVGAHALGFHGAPRLTGDLDLLVRPNRENAARILDALSAFGFGALDLSEEDFAVEDRVVQLGHPPCRIDLLTSITGVTWEQALAGSGFGTFGPLKARYLGRAELIANKRATGRTKDMADLEAIGAE